MLRRLFLLWSAEVLAFAKDDMVTDPQLAQRIDHCGIDMRRHRMTDRTIMEL